VIRIRQPLPGLVSIVVVTLLAMFGVGYLTSVAGLSPISLLLIPLLGGLAFFGYRVVTISATATGEGITVRNLFATHVVARSEVSTVTVEPSPGGRGSSVSIGRSDGSAVSVEATWSPWYAFRGSLEQQNRRRCSEFASEVEAVLSGDTP
jgi:hypothetical protein